MNRDVVLSPFDDAWEQLIQDKQLKFLYALGSIHADPFKET